MRVVRHRMEFPPEGACRQKTGRRGEFAGLMPGVAPTSQDAG